jgi:phosphate-selective porin OprO and OprP
MINSRKSLLTFLVTATALTASPAIAQSNTSEVEALRAEVAALKEQLAALAAKVENVAAAPAPAPASAPAPAAPAAPEKKGGPDIAFKGGAEIKGEGGWSFKARGRLHYDAGYISIPGALNNTRNLGFNARFRRARLGAEGSMPGGFGYKFEADFANNTVSFADFFVTYSPDNAPIVVKIGNTFDVLGGMDQVTSSNNSSFIERAGINEAFNNGRRLGAIIAYNNKNKDFRAEAGIFAAHSIDSSLDNDGWIFGSRLVYAPEALGGRLHFGASYQYRNFASNNGGVASTGSNMPSTNQIARYRTRPNSQLTDVRFIDTGNFAAKSDQVLGLELAGVFDSLYFASEAQWLKSKAYNVGDTAAGLDVFTGGNVALVPSTDPGFFGGYGEIGYFLTGEARNYRHGEGIWGRPKVKNPINKGGSGAFQLAARYEYIDLDDDALKIASSNNFTTGIATPSNALTRGGTQSSYMLGLNWYPIDYIRFMVNYGRVNVEGGPLAGLVLPLSTKPLDERSYGLDVFAARMQLEF